MTGCILLAAGRSLRFGGNKLLYPFQGRFLLDRAIDAIPPGLPAAAVVSCAATARLAENRGLRVLLNDRPEDGISYSIRLGVAALSHCDALIFLVADQPLLRCDTLQRLIRLSETHPGKICAASADGVRGNPCLFPREFYPELLSLRGDRGGSAVIARHRDRLLLAELPKEQLRDIDTRADLALEKEDSPMDIKLIALDLDGTLLTPDKQLSPRNRAALDAAAAKGIHIVPATGRLYDGMPSFIRELPYVRYIITTNGGQVYDAVEKKDLHEACIPLELALRVYDYLDTLPVIYDCYLDGAAYMPRDFLLRAEEYLPGDPHNLQMVRNLRKPVDDFKGFLRSRGRPLQKMQFFLKDPSMRPGYIRELEQRFPDLAISFSMPHNVEINIRNAVKGEALRFLCAYLGFGPGEAAAFGDGLNDVSMLKAAGVGVAMENAEPEALAAANYRTCSNREDGVAVFLEKHIL